MLFFRDIFHINLIIINLIVNYIILIKWGEIQVLLSYYIRGIIKLIIY